MRPLRIGFVCMSFLMLLFGSIEVRFANAQTTIVGQMRTQPPSKHDILLPTSPPLSRGCPHYRYILADSRSYGRSKIGRIRIVNDYEPKPGDTVEIELYNPEAPDTVFGTWHFKGMGKFDLVSEGRDPPNTSGDWGVRILLANGTTSCIESVAKVGTYRRGSYVVRASDIYESPRGAEADTVQRATARLKKYAGGRLSTAGAAFLRSHWITHREPCNSLSAVGGSLWVATYADGSEISNCFWKCQGSEEVASYFLGLSSGHCDSWFEDPSGRRVRVCLPDSGRSLVSQHGPVVAIDRGDECR